MILLLNACSTTPVQLSYNSAALSPGQAAPIVAVGDVVDNRDHDPKWLGAIRGGYGNPIKTLETEQPVSEVVKTTLSEGLSADGLLAKGKSKYRLNVILTQFDCNQVGRREAHILMQVSLIEAGSEQEVYKKTLKADKVTGSRITFDAGIFASVDDLRQVANDVLQDAIDQLLHDPAFHAALR
jgi:uncharacterized lipoprotein YajG